jgi:GntR family transcriptional regulator
MNSNPLLNKAALNRNSPVPLYHQLLEIFHEYLANSTWKAGDWIPTETELADVYKVSEITVRQALLTLTREGRLVRRRGKGTQVTEMVQFSPVVAFNRPSDPFWELENMHVRVLETGYTSEKNAPPNPMSKKGIFYIRRLCSQKESPVIFQTIFVEREVARKVLPDAWTNPSINKVLGPFLSNLTSAKETVEAINLGRYESSILNEREGRMALLVERTLYEDSAPFFFERIIVRFGSLTFMSKCLPV